MEDKTSSYKETFFAMIGLVLIVIFMSITEHCIKLKKHSAQSIDTVQVDTTKHAPIPKN